MRRNVERILQDYDKQIQQTGKETLNANDLQQLFTITTDNGRAPLDPAMLAINAAKLGYMVGMRRGERNKTISSIKTA